MPKRAHDKVILLITKTGKYLEVYVDADFAGNWEKDHSLEKDTERSRHGYIIMYTGFPVVWKSQLQTEITLSITQDCHTR